MKRRRCASENDAESDAGSSSESDESSDSEDESEDDGSDTETTSLYQDPPYTFLSKFRANYQDGSLIPVKKLPFDEYLQKIICRALMHVLTADALRENIINSVYLIIGGSRNKIHESYTNDRPDFDIIINNMLASKLKYVQYINDKQKVTIYIDIGDIIFKTVFNTLSSAIYHFGAHFISGHNETSDMMLVKVLEHWSLLRNYMGTHKVFTEILYPKFTTRDNYPYIVSTAINLKASRVAVITISDSESEFSDTSQDACAELVLPISPEVELSKVDLTQLANTELEPAVYDGLIERGRAVYAAQLRCQQYMQQEELDAPFAAILHEYEMRFRSPKPPSDVSIFKVN